MCVSWCFYPRLRGGGDLTDHSWHGRRFGFYPRLRGGGDDLLRVGYYFVIVSIHASAGEATGNAGRPRALIRVSIHASAGEATKPDWCFSYTTRFLSTPPRGRRLGGVFRVGTRFRVSIHASAGEATPYHIPPGDPLYVSIHASAGEATGPPVELEPLPQVSIHASAGEATRSSMTVFPSTGCFYPRLRGGGDGQA